MRREGHAMMPLTGRPRGDLLLDLLLAALRVDDAQLNALAVELLGRCGDGPVRRLLQEATNPKNRPAHRLRVLQAIRRIGPVTDLASYLDLYVLTQDKHPSVRSAAAQLLGEVGHPHADLAEQHGRAMLPFADPLPAGKRRRVPCRLAPTTGGTGP
jgi:hypothetical protein